jgi:hypothetical protein
MEEKIKKKNTKKIHYFVPQSEKTMYWCGFHKHIYANTLTYFGSENWDEVTCGSCLRQKFAYEKRAEKFSKAIRF